MTSAKQHIKSLQAVLDASDLDERRQRLCGVNEYGLAHLLGFIRLEACMKLYMYEKRGLGKTIIKLDLSGNWSFVEKLKSLDRTKYELCMDPKKKSARHYRNKIAHEGERIDSSIYRELCRVTDWAFENLYTNMPRNFQ